MSALATPLARAFARGSQVAVVNYHLTPARRAAAFDAHLARLAARFAPMGEDDLARHFDAGRWEGRPPGLVPALFNGCRNNYDVMAPLLERHGLVGWFFVVTGWASCPPEAQAAFAAPRRLKIVEDEHPDGRHAMSWDEIRDLDRRGHVIASHTRNHVPLTPSDAAVLDDEVAGAQEDLARELGHPVRSVAGLSGTAWGEDRAADAALGRAGHEFLFSALRVQRLPRG